LKVKAVLPARRELGTVHNIESFGETIYSEIRAILGEESITSKKKVLSAGLYLGKKPEKKKIRLINGILGRKMDTKNQKEAIA